MKRHLSLFFALGLCAAGAYGQNPPGAPPTRPPGLASMPATNAAPPKDYSKIFKDDKEKISYAIGMSVGGNLHKQLTNQEVDIDPEVLAKSFKETLGGAPTLITTEDMTAILHQFQAEMTAKKQKEAKELGEKNAKEGAEFLAANKVKPGVITLPSGLQYKVLAEGKGESPKTNDIVSVHYKGSLIDGYEFDNSEKRGAGKPADFPLRPRGLIDAWLEALPMMKPGSKWEIYVPSNLGYSTRGDARAKIGANAVLIFEIELVSFKAPPPTPTPQPHPAAPGVPGVAPGAAPLTSDIIKVPSAEGLKKGEQITTIKPEDIEKEKAKEKLQQSQTNAAPK